MKLDLGMSLGRWWIKNWLGWLWFN